MAAAAAAEAAAAASTVAAAIRKGNCSWQFFIFWQSSVGRTSDEEIVRWDIFSGINCDLQLRLWTDMVVGGVEREGVDKL